MEVIRNNICEATLKFRSNRNKHNSYKKLIFINFLKKIVYREKGLCGNWHNE
jgi:hypothetical protein